MSDKVKRYTALIRMEDHSMGNVPHDVFKCAPVEEIASEAVEAVGVVFGDMDFHGGDDEWNRAAKALTRLQSLVRE